MKIRKFFSKAINFNTTISLNGQRFVCPRIYGISASRTEEWMIPILKAIRAQTSGQFIDVGVNVGQTLLKVKSVDANWNYVGFEPNPACVFYSREIVRLNKLQAAKILPVGISKTSGLVDLSLYSESSVGSAASIVPDFRPEIDVQQSLPIWCVSYDELPAEIREKKICVLKIDVEGAEPLVLNSMTKAIRRDRPFVFIEVLPAYNLENTARLQIQSSIESFFRENAYRMFRIIRTESGLLSELKPIEKFGIHSDLKQCDYVCAHDESAGIIDTLLQR